jgi:predicted NBD/HSP70 family sugar kinase
MDRRPATARPHTVRRMNRAVVMELIRGNQPLSRADLARMTGIHRSNISLIVDELQKDGLLHEERGAGNGRGRIPTLLSLSRDKFRVIGISVRRAKTTVALAALDGTIESTYIFETPEEPERFVVAVEDACHVMMQHVSAGAKGRLRIRQMVVSIPGIVTREKRITRIWTPGLPRYIESDLAADLSKRTKIPTVVANNAGLAAMAALHSTELTKQPLLNDFVFLMIGDVGVGSGVVIQRSLYSGYDAAYAGEVGHTVIDPNGPPCNCGRRGCWQLYVCDAATWARFQPNTPFSQEVYQQFLEEVRHGNPKAVAALRNTAKYLSLGISNIALTLNPERILLAGALTSVWPKLEPELRSAFFLPHHHAIIQPIDVPVDSLFLRGAVERAIDLVIERSSGSANDLSSG